MNQASKQIYEFGCFRLDAVKRLLWRDGELVPLTSKALETLLALVERPGAILDKNELLSRIWPDTIVEEKNLTINVSYLRRALGESPQDHHYIVTVPGRGYRFVAEVRDGAAAVEELIVQESKVRVVVEEERDELNEGARLPDARALNGSRIWKAAVATLMVALVAGLFVWRGKGAATEAPAIKTLAVMPFKSLKPEATSDDEYFGVGIADVIITRLSNLSQLAVRPTSSVLGLTTEDSLEAGKLLKVDSVLDGSIQRTGGRVRVTVRLVRTSDGQPLWAYQCDEACTDVFSLQDAISEKVTEALALKLTSDERQRLNRRYTENAEAHQAYLKGRYHTLQYTPEGNRQAIIELNEALRIDPTYALAWAGLADAYTAASDWLLPPREALSKAKAAAEKALALDDTLAEAHAALGHVFVHQFNPNAEPQFKRAMELNPNSVAAMFFYFEYFLGRDADKAVAVLRRVQELDPLSPVAGSFIASAYLMARRFDEALQESERTVALDPNNPFSREMLGMAYGAKGNHLMAIAELEKIKPVLPTAEVLGELGFEYALAGRRNEASKILAELKAMSQHQYVSPFSVAVVYVGLLDKDQAFAWLEKAREDQSEWMGWLQYPAFLDPIRDDPRFTDLVRRVGSTN